ncbi:MAG: hypothetical protein IPJ88_14200 [Myxococcales bacterium]|nr:MAG: hypothetical protein IPJ88_14200 [Myxococcales bacterium]
MYEYDGSSWSTLCNGCAPGTRYGHGFAYDSVRDVVVLFGGVTGANSESNELWEWDGSSWTQVSPLGSVPAVRQGVSMTYDSSRSRVVIFGGYDSPATYYNDTYEYDGLSWYGPFTPATRPPVRYDDSAQLAFVNNDAQDPALRNRVILYGGLNSSSFYDDMWSWDGSSWLEFGSNDGTGTKRYASAVVYDGGSGRLLVIGGYDGSELSGTYQYDTVWSLASLLPDQEDTQAAAYHPVWNVIVKYGGNSPNCLGFGSPPYYKNCDTTYHYAP